MDLKGDRRGYPSRPPPPLLPLLATCSTSGGSATLAKHSLDAGGGAIFPETMGSAAEFAAFAKAVPCPLLANMTEFGKSPLLDVKTLGAIGYRMILFPLTAFRVAMKAAEDTLRDLLDKGTQACSVAKMMTRAELYDLLGYTGYEERDREYFGGTSWPDASEETTFASLQPSTSSSPRRIHAERLTAVFLTLKGTCTTVWPVIDFGLPYSSPIRGAL